MRTRQPFEDVPLEFEEPPANLELAIVRDTLEEVAKQMQPDEARVFMEVWPLDGVEAYRLGMRTESGTGDVGHVSAIDHESGKVTVSAGSPPPRPVHPDAVEKGIELPLGFMPHKGENRRTRRAAVAQWVPHAEAVAEVAPIGQKMPTRRELWLQRQKHRRGKLDIETRRLQKERLK